VPGDATFGTLWRMLELYAPKVPVPLLKQFVNNSYSRALVQFPWSELRRTGALRLAAPYTTGTVTVTNGSVTVVGSGTSWTSADHATLQLVVGNRGPFFDIASVESGTSLTLASPFVGTSASGASYTIQQIYIVPPANFIKYTSFLDTTPATPAQLDFSMTQEVLDFYDPGRTITAGRPTHLVNAESSPFAATLRRPRYEVWPRPSEAFIAAFRYVVKPDLLVGDDDTIIYPLRGDVIREGAFADLAAWPGTDDSPNTYYDASGGRSQFHDRRFQEGIALCKGEDSEIASKMVAYKEEWRKLSPFRMPTAGTATVSL
jgi:hypothetical protein